MTAISDIPIVEPITGNKRHTYYSTATETDSKPALPTTTTAKATFPIPTIVQSPQKKISASKDSDKQPLLGNDQDSNSKYLQLDPYSYPRRHLTDFVLVSPS